MKNSKAPIPTFSIGEEAYYKGRKVSVLKTSTYCVCCDRFLNEVTHTLLEFDGDDIYHNIPESHLTFEEEQ